MTSVFSLNTTGCPCFRFFFLLLLRIQYRRGYVGNSHTDRKPVSQAAFYLKLKNLWFSQFQKKIEDAKAQKQFVSLDKELRELKRAVVTSDKLAATELTIAKDQLKALHGTVLRINEERAEVKQH